MKLVEGQIRLSASDYSNFLACRHLTRLEIAAAHGLTEEPHIKDLGFAALVKRGQEHEKQVLQQFRDQGLNVATITNPFEDFERAVVETELALAGYVDVIYQAALRREDRIGFPDFLVRAGLLGGDEGYEVVDAKLARSAKARAVLQATFYSRLLTEATGIQPVRLHLALGNRQLASFDFDDYAAYERQIDRLLREFTAVDVSFPPSDTYPDPVEHCAICRWRVMCVRRRRDDDDLSLIAGITSSQRKALKEASIETRRGFAGLDRVPDLPRVGKGSLAKAQAQARIQVEGEDVSAPRWELVDPEREDGQLVPDRGLLALPEPAEGDLFFDIEGSRFYSEDGKEFGLQYLFGLIDSGTLDDRGAPRYLPFWGFDRAGERRAFEELMDFLTTHLDRYPQAHIYHYNHYEPTAVEHLSELHTTREDVLRRLMGRFATREDDIDDLLRRRIFVDLYRVVRQGIRASVESYSIKRLEPFIGYQRQVELEEVNERIVGFEMSLDEGTAEADSDIRAVVQGYNEDDCRATLALRDWLEARRRDLADQLDVELPRPVPLEPPEDSAAPEVRELREALLTGVPQEVTEWTDEQSARALMAELLEYHRREAKPLWWRYFHLKGLNDDELMRERDAIAGLVFREQVGTEARSTLDLYAFPPQEHSLDKGDGVEDPIGGTKFAIWALDEAEGTLTLKRGPKAREAPHPTALIPSETVYRTDAQRESLRELAQRVIEAEEGAWPRDPAFDLLLRRRPNADEQTAGPLVSDGEEGLDAARRLALALDHSCLPIQGPPGTGKTYTGASQIVTLVGAGKRVGITAMSHAVISNMLDEVVRLAKERASVRIGQRAARDEESVSYHVAGTDFHFTSNPDALAALEDHAVDIIGGTSWLWSRPEFKGTIDVLVVDEAGQMSLADVLACSRAANGLILLGDPLQLAHPSQGWHPPIVPSSALDHVLGEAATMPDDRGLFIQRTRRMHPAITAFTSEVFYDKRLTGLRGLERQEVIGDGPFAGSGIRVVDVHHQGNANSAPEEAAMVGRIVRHLLRCRWRNRDGDQAMILPDDILVVTPFNAQIRQITEALRALGLAGIRVGTVDKFQGRQAPVVVYSMASSSSEDAPRGMEFLYDLHRLNVATSRALCLAIVVGSPELVRVFAKTPRQMHLANALCRLREFAENKI
jgi:predicted RecB family nuclease